MFYFPSRLFTYLRYVRTVREACNEYRRRVFGSSRYVLNVKVYFPPRLFTYGIAREAWIENGVGYWEAPVMFFRELPIF